MGDEEGRGGRRMAKEGGKRMKMVSEKFQLEAPQGEGEITVGLAPNTTHHIAT